MITIKRYPALSALAVSMVTSLLYVLPCMAQKTAGSDARSILEDVLRMQNERLEKIENYTLVQTLNGVEATLYFERVDVDGVPAFRNVPPHEYQKAQLEMAGLSTGFPATAAGGGAGPAIPSGPLGNLPLPAGVSLPEGLAGALANTPGAKAGQSNLLKKATGAALGAATGELQQQLTQKGMQSIMNMATPDNIDGEVEDPTLPARLLAELGTAAQLQGTEEVDGSTCFVIRIADPGLASVIPGGKELGLRSITQWIDTEEYVPRRTVTEGQLTVEGRARDLAIEVSSQDYRRVDGMYEPFRRTIRVAGMLDALAAHDPKKAKNVSKEMQQAIAQMEKMDEMLAKMPPEQRRMVEAQMGEARDRLKQLSGAEPGSIEMLTEVKELRVNAGPPTPFGTGAITLDGAVRLAILEMIVQITPGTDAAGRPAGWVIQLLGGVAERDGGIMQLQVTEDVPTSGETSGNAGASFRWKNGTEALLSSNKGNVRVTITRSATRLAGEFSFEAQARIRSPEGTRTGRTTVHGTFDAPIPPAPPGLPLEGTTLQ
jgi:hypothetical protein